MDNEYVLLIIILILILPAIIYFTYCMIRAAVKEGVLNALIDYDKYKRDK